MLTVRRSDAAQTGDFSYDRDEVIPPQSAALSAIPLRTRIHRDSSLRGMETRKVIGGI